MFSSSNLFQNIDCPFFKIGFCERPRCHFNHIINNALKRSHELESDDKILKKCNKISLLQKSIINEEQLNSTNNFDLKTEHTKLITVKPERECILNNKVLDSSIINLETDKNIFNSFELPINQSKKSDNIKCETSNVSSSLIIKTPNKIKNFSLSIKDNHDMNDKNSDLIIVKSPPTFSSSKKNSYKEKNISKTINNSNLDINNRSFNDTSNDLLIVNSSPILSSSKQKRNKEEKSNLPNEDSHSSHNYRTKNSVTIDNKKFQPLKNNTSEKVNKINELKEESSNIGFSKDAVHQLKNDNECYKIFSQKRKQIINRSASIKKNEPPISLSNNVNDISSHQTIQNKIRIAHPAAQKIEKIDKKLSIEIDNNCKITSSVRQGFLDLLVNEYVKIFKSSEEANLQALSNEKLVRNECTTNQTYRAKARKIISNLRNSSGKTADSSKSDSCTLNSVKSLYDRLEKYLVPLDQLESLGFPQRCSSDHSKIVVKNVYNKYTLPQNLNGNLKVCCRCSQTFNINTYLLTSKVDTCIYHSGSSWKKKVSGSFESIFNCCQGDINSKGCQSSKNHVFDDNKYLDLDGFQETFTRKLSEDNPTIYALDCEMLYTTGGCELARVTIIDHEFKLVMDKLVCPSNKIIDYNTKFSGIKEEMMADVETTLQDIQTSLLYLFTSQSILIGHSLESDLIALKLIHNKIIDTSVTFPHRLGLPYKRSLKTLSTEILRKVIQDSAGGHDSKEDASTCMHLMLWKLKNDIKK